MAQPATCNQKGCENPAAYRFTWPGENEAVICEQCAPKLRGVAGAIGLYLQLIPIETPLPPGQQPADNLWGM